MININAKKFKAYAKMMRKSFPKQYAFATRMTLDNMAFESSSDFKKFVADDVFTVRNDFIKKSVQFDKASGFNVDTMQSAFGQVKKFRGQNTKGQLDIQDKGGVKKAKGKKLWKATQAARTSKTYKKPIAKRYRMISDTQNSGIMKSAKTPKQKRSALIQWAKRTGFKGLMMFKSPVTGKSGAYQVVGKKVLKIYDTSKTSQAIKATNWMAKSYKRLVRDRDKFYGRNMSKQIEFLKRYNKL